MDRILVLDAGQVIEFGEAYVLLRNQSGLFYNMVKQTGPKFEKMLHKMAEKSYFKKESDKERDSKQ